MTRKKQLFLLTAVAALCAVLWLVPESQGLRPAGKAALAVGAFAILVWMTQAIEDALSALVITNMLGLATGEITAGELMKTGAIFSVYGAAFMSVMVYTYWSWIGMF